MLNAADSILGGGWPRAPASREREPAGPRREPVRKKFAPREKYGLAKLTDLGRQQQQAEDPGRNSRSAPAAPAPDRPPKLDPYEFYHMVVEFGPDGVWPEHARRQLVLATGGSGDAAAAITTSPGPGPGSGRGPRQPATAADPFRQIRERRRALAADPGLGPAAAAPPKRRLLFARPDPVAHSPGLQRVFLPKLHAVERWGPRFSERLLPRYLLALDSTCTAHLYRSLRRLQPPLPQPEQPSSRTMLGSNELGPLAMPDSPGPTQQGVAAAVSGGAHGPGVRSAPSRRTNRTRTLEQQQRRVAAALRAGDWGGAAARERRAFEVMLAAVNAATAAQVRRLGASALAAIPGGLAACGVRAAAADGAAAALLRAWGPASAAAMRRASPAQLAETALGLGALGLAPGPAWTRAFLMEVARKLHRFRPLQLTDLLRGFTLLFQGQAVLPVLPHGMAWKQAVQLSPEAAAAAAAAAEARGSALGLVSGLLLQAVRRTLSAEPLPAGTTHLAAAALAWAAAALHPPPPAWLRWLSAHVRGTVGRSARRQLEAARAGAGAGNGGAAGVARPQPQDMGMMLEAAVQLLKSSETGSSGPGNEAQGAAVKAGVSAGGAQAALEGLVQLLLRELRLAAQRGAADGPLLARACRSLAALGPPGGSAAAAAPRSTFALAAVRATLRDMSALGVGDVLAVAAALRACGLGPPPAAWGAAAVVRLQGPTALAGGSAGQLLQLLELLPELVQGRLPAPFVDSLLQEWLRRFEGLLQGGAGRRADGWPLDQGPETERFLHQDQGGAPAPVTDEGALGLDSGPAAGSYAEAGGHSAAARSPPLADVAPEAGAGGSLAPGQATGPVQPGQAAVPEPYDQAAVPILLKQGESDEAAAAHLFALLARLLRMACARDALCMLAQQPGGAVMTVLQACLQAQKQLQGQGQPSAAQQQQQQQQDDLGSAIQALQSFLKA